jgi:hypothetical protein
MAVIYTLLFIYLFWVFYLGVMSLWRAHRDGLIGPVAYVPGYLTLAIGAVMDVVFNATLGSLLFFERPYEVFFTKRLQRHIRTGGGWRRKLALWLCHHLLNPFDPTGDHCD